MTTEEAKELLADIKGNIIVRVYSQYVEALEVAIKALEQEPCDDAISREAVKNMLNEEWTKYMPMELDINLSFVLEKISELPSVTPSRPKGRWIEQKDIHKHHYGWFFCSECGEFLMSSDGANYCSCCGAKMLGDYVMCAASFDIRPRGTILETSLGMAIVVDTGTFAYNNQTQIDLCVTW